MKRAFTLVEILIVVAILGILAAIVVPQFQSHTTQAKEAAAKDNLRLFRSAVELYAVQHNDIPPGYYDNGSITPTFLFYAQLTNYTSAKGFASTTKSQSYPYGPYLKKLPANPFNNEEIVRLLADDDSFPDSADGSYGWIYQPATKTIRIDWPGTDKKGIRYYDY